MTIKLLDCTLRDGGFINDWHFGLNATLGIFQRVVNARIDVVEIGFINENRPKSAEYTINPTTTDFDKLFKGMNKGNSMVVGMVDYGTCNIENISPCENSFIDGIRVIFKKQDIAGAMSYCQELKNKGYKVFVQPVSITTYSDRDMLDLIDKVNELMPYSMSIVDTYGLMHKDNLLKYFFLMDKNLNPSIMLGYHSHNNFQLAYSNSTELMEVKTNREILIDGSLYGMGKGAGNANIELLAMYMNENFGSNYDVNELLEAIDTEILKLYKKYEWGYKLSHYVSALNDCHPSYTSFLKNKNTLSIKSINEILKNIDGDKKLVYDKKHIEELYVAHQKHDIDDTSYYEQLHNELNQKNILLLGPGRSIVEQKDKILDFINRYNPIIFSINHISSIYNPDYVFISNAKRYGQYANILINKNNSFKVIATSNITALNDEFDFILNYGKLLNSNEIISDNAMSMLLTAFCDLKIENVSLAGFDGFTANNHDYFDDYLEFSEDNKDKMQFNEAVKEQLQTFSNHMKINFLTQSAYEIKKEDYAKI